MPRRSSAHIARHAEALVLQPGDDARARCSAWRGRPRRAPASAPCRSRRRRACRAPRTRSSRGRARAAARTRARRGRRRARRSAHARPRPDRRRDGVRGHGAHHTGSMRRNQILTAIFAYAYNAGHERPLPNRSDPAAFDRRAWVTLLVLCGVLFLDGLDVSMVGVALPSIDADLGPLHLDPAVGGERLRARLRRPAAARRPHGRPARAAARAARRARGVRRARRCSARSSTAARC